MDRKESGTGAIQIVLTPAMRRRLEPNTVLRGLRLAWDAMVRDGIDVPVDEPLSLVLTVGPVENEPCKVCDSPNFAEREVA